VASAKQSGLLNGLVNGDNAFKPNEPLTRQEMALILANVAANKHVKSTNNVKATDFHDYTRINEHYVKAVELAINVGFLSENGMGDGNFSPHSYTTRAQAALIQTSMIRILGELE